VIIFSDGILRHRGKQANTMFYRYVQIRLLRAAPDPNKGNKPDYQGWFDAYAQYFNTKENPVKTARSTVGVESLVSPDFLIEIEAEVAYKNTNK
jgi:enamine deaminase RidA (YjgF/YER057c/UK114 family)